MLIACTYWVNNKNNNELGFYQAVQHVQLLAQKQPTIKFFLYSNYINSKDFNGTNNLQIIVINSTSKLGKKYLEIVQFKKQLQSIRLNIVIHFNDIVSLNTIAPQLAFLYQPPSKNNILNYLKLNRILVTNYHYKQILLDKYLVNENKVEVIFPASSEHFKALPFEKTSLVKDSFADGREYFLYIITSEYNEQFITVLKAFSQFKKWQKSSMKLIVVSRFTQLSNINKEKLDTYKFKEDVVIVEQPNDEQYAKILASAYATIYLSQNCNLNLPWFEILQTQQPLITSDLIEIKEITRDAALFVNDNNVDDVAAQMQSIYKDENLRSMLINKAKYISEAHLQSNSIDKFWQIIQKAVQV